MPSPDERMSNLILNFFFFTLCTVLCMCLCGVFMYMFTCLCSLTTSWWRRLPRSWRLKPSSLCCCRSVPNTPWPIYHIIMIPQNHSESQHTLHPVCHTVMAPPNHSQPQQTLHPVYHTIMASPNHSKSQQTLHPVCIPWHSLFYHVMQLCCPCWKNQWTTVRTWKPPKNNNITHTRTTTTNFLNGRICDFILNRGR